MVNNEYEVIQHNNSNFHIFLVNLIYRTPHIHKDYEISLVLDGNPNIITTEGTTRLSPGDIFIMNPFFSHEITSQEPALIMSLQISPAFFATYFPQIERTEFSAFHLSARNTPQDCHAIRDYLFQLAHIYYENQDNASIKCAILINQLFLYLFESQPHHLIADKEMQASQMKGKRMRKIMKYIDEHYAEKLLLSDIAEQEELDLYYLSHFFKESFGITFQNYLTKIRSERARQLLLLTDYSLLDISITCGFSDPKYFNKGFALQYGCSPKEYRKNFQNAHLEQQQKSVLTTQEFLSEGSSLITLQNYE